MSDTKTQACQWKYCESECSWDTQCDNKYQFMNDGPKENDYKFCPGCGKPVTLAGDEQPASVEPEELKALASATGSAAGVESEACSSCEGNGSISYNPNLNPNAFPATASAKCTHCGGTGSVEKAKPQPNAADQTPPTKNL